METIKNYLETMFQNLPNLPEVQKAKYELGQMMEDKYQELKEEGKSENEAVAIIISEFGNLDELAEELGIETALSEDAVSSRRVSFEEAKQYIKAKVSAGYKVALGIFLCIMSPSGSAILDEYHNEFLESVGTISLLLMVAVAVALFVFASMSMGKWNYLKKQNCTIDFATTEYVHNEKENFQMTKVLMVTIGVALCIFSTVPVIIFDEIVKIEHLEGYGVSLMFLCVSVAVFLFVAAGYRGNAYDQLLKLNGRETMGGQFVSSQKTQVYYENKTLRAFMSVYWYSVTCIYLCWSFLTFEWYLTWIVWPVAAIMKKVIEMSCGDNNKS